MAATARMNPRRVLGRATALVAFVLMELYGLVGAAFVVGESLMDPGGTAGVLYAAAWLVPTVALIAYTLRSPQAAARALTVIAGAVASFVVLDGALGIVPRGEGTAVGPVGSIAVLAVSLALGFLGLRRPARAGFLLVLLGAAEVAGGYATVVVHGGGRPAGAALGGSAAAVTIPALIVGGLFLIAAFLQRAPQPPTARTAGETTPPGSRFDQAPDRPARSVRPAPGTGPHPGHARPRRTRG